MAKQMPRTVEIYYKESFGQWMAKDVKQAGCGIILSLPITDKNAKAEAIKEAALFCEYPASKIKVIEDQI